MSARSVLNRMAVRKYATEKDYRNHPMFKPEGHGSSSKHLLLWEKLVFFVGVPALVLASINAYIKTKEEEKTIKRPEFKRYDHMRIMNKPFPWGDGKHTFFHNKYRNALPDGYETDEEEHH